MMNTEGSNSRDLPKMSDAAAQTLDELMSGRRDEVLELARQVSSHEVLTAADVVRAYHSSESRGPSPGGIPRTLVSKRSYLWSAIIAAMAGLASVLSLTTVYRERLTGNSIDSFGPTTAVVFSAIAIAILAASYFMSRAVRSYYIDREKQASAAITIKQGDVLSSARVPETVAIDDLNAVSFLVQWSRVENRLQKLANNVLKRADSPRRSGPLPLGKAIAILLDDRAIDGSLESDIRRVLLTRNMVAHGEHVSENSLKEATEVLRRVQNRLDMHPAV